MDYMDDRIGFYERISDTAWVMDDYGNLVRVSFCLPVWFFQEV